MVFRAKITDEAINMERGAVLSELSYSFEPVLHSYAFRIVFLCSPLIFLFSPYCVPIQSETRRIIFPFSPKPEPLNVEPPQVLELLAEMVLRAKIKDEAIHLSFGFPAIHKSTCWVCGTNLSTFERIRARVHQSSEPK